MTEVEAKSNAIREWGKAFIHNCVIHPLLPFVPQKIGNVLHDKNANWAFGLDRYDEIALEHSNLPPKVNNDR